MRKKAVIFTTDALMSISMLMIVAAIVLSQNSVRSPNNYLFEQAQTISEDSMKSITTIQFSEVDEALRQKIIEDTNVTISDEENTVSYVIGELWAENTTTSMYYARNLTQEYIGKIVPPGYKYGLFIDDEEIYSDERANYSVLSASRRLISGIHEGKPSKGTSTRISISNILSKNTAKFLYFGGFVGEGNITKTFQLPSVIGNVTEVYIEMDTMYNYTLTVNDNPAGTYVTNNSNPMIAKNWTMDSQYYNHFTPGENWIRINFTGTSTGYIGGGYIKVSYNTSQMDTTMLTRQGEEVTERYYFPGIDGFINLYTSFYVPGTLNSMSAKLHFYNPYDTYLYIGSTKIYENHTNSTQFAEFNNTVLSSMLNYADMSSNTIPIRFGIKNITGLSDGSDVVLITDVSGSMASTDIPPNRLAVAKECDKDFVDTILNNEEQKVGLVSYTTTTNDIMQLTDNNQTLKNRIDTYTALSMTCISCGIYDSTEMLKPIVGITTLIDTGDTWSYNDSYLNTDPPADSEGNEWYDYNYTLESQWHEGPSVLGYNGAIPETTTIAEPLDIGITTYANLWDDNTTTIPVSFESGYNSTANTYGWNAGNDGWDHDTSNNQGPFGYDDNIDYNDVVDGKLEFDTRTGTYNRNYCSGQDCTGAYGIEIEISQEEYDIINNQGTAKLSFQYEWQGNYPQFEDSDEVWIKARWTDSTNARYYLGDELSNANSDTTPEIDYRSNPDSSIPATYTTQDITGYINSPGTYYLEIGGKVIANSYDEWGYFRFDDIMLEIRNGTSDYYFRKNFTIDNMNVFGRGILKVASEGGAEIYLNGEKIESDPSSLHEASYWNRVELIDRSFFRPGNNVLAARLYSHIGTAAFDIELNALNTSRNRAMLVMSDGEANYCNPNINCADDLAAQEAIDFACDAYENYGIISHAVGFGSAVDEDTMESIAECGHGMYRSSTDSEELRVIYQDIANAMVSYSTQKSTIIGQYSPTTLYPDSYIEYNYTPTANLDYGEISLTFSSDTFGETSGNTNIEIPKNGSYWIPPEVEIIDAKTTSYSSDYWTSILNMKSEETGWTNVFNLSSYHKDFTKLGDPYIVYMPTEYIGKNQTNWAELNTGTNETWFTGGSPSSRVIYSLKIKSTASYSEISPKADGCTWTVEQYNNINTSLKIPTTYTGTKECRFTATELYYDEEDSIDNAAIMLLQQLDVTGDRKIDIAIDQTNIDIRILKVQDIPWMWGPAIMKLEIWK